VVFDDGTETTVFDDLSEPESSNSWVVRAPSDVNGDGHLDVVAKDMFTGEVVAVFLGDGHGGFAAK
jgi:hypothetical protein